MASDRIDSLGKINLFDGVTREALEAIASITEEQTAPAGTLLFAHGDVGDRLFLILEGKVRISRDIPGIGEEALAVLVPATSSASYASSTTPRDPPTRACTSAVAS